MHASGVWTSKGARRSPRWATGTGSTRSGARKRDRSNAEQRLEAFNEQVPLAGLVLVLHCGLGDVRLAMRAGRLVGIDVLVARAAQGELRRNAAESCAWSRLNRHAQLNQGAARGFG